MTKLESFIVYKAMLLGIEGLSGKNAAGEDYLGIPWSGLNTPDEYEDMAEPTVDPLSSPSLSVPLNFHDPSLGMKSSMICPIRVSALAPEMISRPGLDRKHDENTSCPEKKIYP